MARMIVMIILLIAGMGCLLYAKLHFAKRQETDPDNQWSKRENQMRYLGYAICITDVIIAGFINF
ncbi:MAG: hypothetical protein EOM64_01120 [Erysipelotrichia bacterium]|nr:hypothetical protein [Erysipelotrichia bacterium]